MADYHSSSKELAKLCQNRLDQICTTGAEIFAALKNPKEKIHVNLKALRVFAHSKEPRYEVVARSANPDDNRLSDDMDRIEPYLLQDNAFHQHILKSDTHEDYCLVNNIEEFLKDSPYREPHPNLAPTFYKSGIVVAVKGRRSMILEGAELPEQRIALPYRTDETLFGFVCVDSKQYDLFNADGDLHYLRHVAAAAFETLRVWYIAYSLGHHPPLTVV